MTGIKSDEYMLARAISIAQQTNTSVVVVAKSVGRAKHLFHTASDFESSILEGVVDYKAMRIGFPKNGKVWFVVMPNPEDYHYMGGWQITHAFMVDDASVQDVAVVRSKIRAARPYTFTEPMGIYNKFFVERMEDY